MIYLFDIEGTITDIKFVHKVLFPYAEVNLEKFVRDNSSQDEIRSSLDKVKQTLLEEKGLHANIDQAIQALLDWIREDRKHPALKEIQGHIWESGFKNNDFKGHLYRDAYEFFVKLKKSNHKLAIYSSGSVKAQKLLLAHTEFGNLTPMFDFYFDTSVGHKRETNSYQNILKQVGDNVTFFSDIEEELIAASQSGIKCYRLLRDEKLPSQFACLSDFTGFEV